MSAFIPNVNSNISSLNNISESCNFKANSSSNTTTSDKLKKLQISNNKNESCQENINSNLSYEELVVTIRKSEKGFGFELRNGILIVKVLPNTPAFHSGIKVGDIIIKVNGTCVRSKEPIEITSMIHESNSFVSLTLQRHLSSTSNKSNENSVEQSSQLKNIDNEQLSTYTNNDLINDFPKQPVTNDHSDENMDEYKNEENEKSEKNFFNNTILSSPNTNSKSIFTNQELTMNKENIKQSKINSKSEDQNPVHSNIDFDMSKNSNRRAIKKTRSSTNPSSKTFQTKSLSNITSSSLNHSSSDNDLDKNQTIDPDDQNIIDYKDEIPYDSDENIQEAHNEKLSVLDVSGFSDYNELINKPINLSILLNYLLSSQNENPKNFYFCIFVDELINSNDKKETILRWAYEIYSTFLMTNAPLKIKSNEFTCRKIEEILEKNTHENFNLLKKLFEEIKQEAIEVVNQQLNRFREVKQIGLANLFHGNDLIKLSQTQKNEWDLIRNTLAESFHMYISEIAKEINKICLDWNDIPKHQEAYLSGLICSFATFIKKFNIPIKYIGKIELEKIPMFVNRKSKIKKLSSNNRGHSFVEYQFISPKSLCAKCNQPFWGISSQGFLCQKSKCEMKLHRSCLNSGSPSDCNASQKNIRTDYKEKFQSILFGSKKKEEESLDINSSKNQFYSQNSISSTQFSNNNGSSNDFSNNNRTEYDRQASIISGDSNQLSNFSTDYDQTRNLPVELAIKKFEMLNAKKSIPPLVSCPSGNQTTLQRTSTMNSGSASPTNSSIFRHNSISNVMHNFDQNLNNNQNSDPEPDEIKSAIHSSQELNKITFDPNSVEDPSNSSNNPNHNISVQQSNSSFSNKTSTSQNISNINAQIQTSSSLFGIGSSSSGINNPSSLTTANRHMWMTNDSDMEVDEELPSLIANIEKDILTRLDKKQLKIQEVINELIHTEQKHVRNLKIMKYHFYIPIKVEMYLTDEERNLLFPNLDEILELHSSFNNRLKELRKENPIVSLKQLIEIILDQFEGDIGYRFKTACAKFCQNQGEAMKLLQNKIKHDKFSLFLTRAENDQVCRKLHLKDFIPTEVQRLVKYRLLFQELTKNANDDDKAKLLKCIDASSNISQYVNKAVTECENKKRCKEIQSRMDTREFDQYCVKSPLLAQYKNLDLRARKLVYEGELEWSSNGSLKLMVFLFEDILVFLEKERSNEEKRRYVLRPLLYTITKKMTFTPVVPIQCINSFSASHEKRNFHIVVIMDKSQSKSIEPQMLFMFTAKSGDERNKWIHHLQELTGKMSQNDKNLNTSVDLTSLTVSSNDHSDFTPSINLKSQNSLSSNISAPNLISHKNNISKINLNVYETSITNNELNNSSIDSNSNNSNEMLASILQKKLNENTLGIIELLKSRHHLLAQMLRVENISGSTDITKDLISSENDECSSSHDLINHSFNLLNIMTSILINDDFKSQIFKNNRNEQKIIEVLIKFENNLKNLQKNINIDITENQTTRLPNLNLNFTNNNDYDNYEEDDGRKRNRRHKSTNSFKNSRSNSLIRSRTKSDPRNKFIQRFNDNDLQQSSIISSMSTNADLSEDEQINYYDESLNNQQNNDNNNKLNSPDPISIMSSIKMNQSTSNRRLSNCSDRTLVVMPAESLMTENISHELSRSNLKLKVNDKHLNKYHLDLPSNHESDESDKGNNSEYVSDENQSDENNSDDEVLNLKEFDQDVNKINPLDPNNELISIEIKAKCYDDEENFNNYDQSPSLPENDPPNIVMVDLVNNQITNINNNDLSDDEVKDYSHII